MSDKLYLTHIRDSVEKIDQVAQEGREAFLQEFRLHDSVIRNFEIIGEATKHLSEESKALQPQIPWKDVAGFRDILIHQYFGIDLEEVWRIIDQSLPALRQAVSNLLETLE